MIHKNKRGTPKGVLTNLVRTGGIPDQQLLDFRTAILDRFAQMMANDETPKDGYGMEIRRL